MIQLSKQTSIFGLNLWIILGITAGAIFVLILFLISLIWFTKIRSKQPIKPITTTTSTSSQSTTQRLSGIEQQALLLTKQQEEDHYYSHPRIQIQMGRGQPNRVLYPERFCGASGGEVPVSSPGAVGPEVSHLGWGHWYTLRELELATDGFADENVIGQGGYGIVYHGVVGDNNTQVAVKNLLNNRILVYEYVNNGNLEQWIHGDVGPCSPLTWEIRMKIIIGVAKALTYLHEGLEPKVVHRDIKSSNILLDKLWNSKVSDFGLAKLLGADTSYITTRVMGTLGYVAPEYARTGMVNEKSDVYSFGILLMELISGRYPVDYKRPQEEVYLVDWVKLMVCNKSPEKVLDPKMIERPSSRVLKRILMVALCCVDLNSEKRPKIGHVVHMLESEDQSHSNERRGVQDSRVAPHGNLNDTINTK
ncbi:probable serine/threonine-protein kinase At1g01540 isoform X2 [Rutidosis leptorrhynchoides]|uniref:probable serine/threonine-protein kinase At1g01540 isoform X2 n=1 Tax=Rutidosis leptorrhynchoides TaxID=125765 RepID=UPI003A98DEBE